MTFTLVDIIYALAFGLIVGVFVLIGFNSQHKDSNAGALAALQQRMGPLFGVAIIAAGGLPLVVVGLLSSALRGQPSLGDIFLLIIFILLAILGSFTLIGNLMTLLGERTPPDRQS